MASEHDRPGRTSRFGRLAARIARVVPRRLRDRAAPDTRGAGDAAGSAGGGGEPDGADTGRGREAEEPREPRGAPDAQGGDAAESDAPASSGGAQAGAASAPAAPGRRRLLKRTPRTGAEDTPRFTPTPLGLLGVVAAAMFVTLLLIQSVMGAFRAAGPENAPGGEDPGPPTAAAPPEGTSRVMIVGDSIVQGSTGDFTWRYRLWRHLDGRSGADVDFVGPYDSVVDDVTASPGATGYADADFDTDHAGRWGATAAELADGVGEQVAEYAPHYLLFMAGVNDFFGGRSAGDALSAVRDAVTAARVAESGVRIVLGEVTPVGGSGSDGEINARIARFNAALPGLAAEMSGARSPVAVAGTASGFAPADDTWDGIHPGAGGEVKIAAAFADALAADLRLGDPFPRPLPEVGGGPRTAPEVESEQAAGGVRLSWGPVPGATRYEVLQQRLRPDRDERVRLPLEVADPGAGERPSAVVDGLLAGATYEFVVQPFKGGDGGVRSDPVEVVYDDEPPPAPDRVRVGPGGGRLSWAEVPSATHYEVWRRPLRCRLPDSPPESAPAPTAGAGTAEPPSDTDSGGAGRPGAPSPGTDPAECEPRDGRGPGEGEGWSGAAVVDGATAWSIGGGARGWEFAVRAHRDYVGGGYSATVSGGAP